MNTNISAENLAALNAARRSDGKFGNRPHTESDVSLASPSSDLGGIALTQLGTMARNRALENLDRAESLARGHLSTEDDFQRLSQARGIADLAKRFESLDRDRQAELVGDDLLQLLDSPRFGTEDIALAEDFEHDEDTVLIGLGAQQQVQAANLPGEATFVSALGQEAVFEIREEGITHRLAIGMRSYAVSVEEEDEISESMDAYEWRCRSDLISAGVGGLRGKPGDIAEMYSQYRANAVAHQEMGASKLAGSHEWMAYLDYETRSIELNVDEAKYTLVLDGEDSVLQDDRGKALHPAMVAPYLDAAAQKAGLSDGTDMLNELRGVFDRTQKRL